MTNISLFGILFASVSLVGGGGYVASMYLSENGLNSNSNSKNLYSPEINEEVKEELDHAGKKLIWQSVYKGKNNNKKECLGAIESEEKKQKIGIISCNSTDWMRKIVNDNSKVDGMWMTGDRTWIDKAQESGLIKKEYGSSYFFEKGLKEPQCRPVGKGDNLVDIECDL